MHQVPAYVHEHISGAHVPTSTTYVHWPQQAHARLNKHMHTGNTSDH